MENKWQWGRRRRTNNDNTEQGQNLYSNKKELKRLQSKEPLSNITSSSLQRKIGIRSSVGGTCPSLTYSAIRTFPKPEQPDLQIQASSPFWSQVEEVTSLLLSSVVDPDLWISVGMGYETKLLECHKMFFQIRSAELKKLGEDAKGGVIYLPWVNPKAFHHFLSYLYRNEFPAAIDLDEADCINILKLGIRFCPKEEEQICTRLMDGRITLKNVFILQLKSVSHKLRALEMMTAKYIAKVNQNAEDYITTQDFLQLEPYSLWKLLKSDELACPEIKLFVAVLKWGQDKGSASSPSLRAKLESVIHMIRFPLMETNQLIEIVEPTGILTAEEMHDLYEYKNNRPNFCTFETRPRIGTKEFDYYVDLFRVKIANCAPPTSKLTFSLSENSFMTKLSNIVDFKRFYGDLKPSGLDHSSMPRSAHENSSNRIVVKLCWGGQFGMRVLIRMTTQLHKLMAVYAKYLRAKGLREVQEHWVRLTFMNRLMFRYHTPQQLGMDKNNSTIKACIWNYTTGKWMPLP